MTTGTPTLFAPTPSLTELTALVRSVADDVSAWQPHVRIPVGAERWWTQLSSDSQVDVWLLAWLPGHSTDLHDHGSSAAAFAVAHGRLAELRVDNDGQLRTHIRPAGSVTALAPGVIHDVHGVGSGPAVSIHAYSPSLRLMNYYDVDDLGQVSVVRTAWTDEPEKALAR